MFVVDNTPLGAWHRLLGEAQQELGYFLTEDIESYLAFTLIRFTDNTHLIKNAVALEFLDSLDNGCHDSLRDVGDKCLIMGGLFPEHATSRNLRADYFVMVGQSAYSTIAQDANTSLYTLYQALTESFAPCTEVLGALRVNEKAAKQMASLTDLH